MQKIRSALSPFHLSKVYRKDTRTHCHKSSSELAFAIGYLNFEYSSTGKSFLLSFVVCYGCPIIHRGNWLLAINSA